jgi:multidrug resistance efflux pump
VPEESEGKKLFNRLKEATANVTQMTREQVADLQAKKELWQTYADLGRKTVELVESGAISHPELSPMVERVDELKAQLAAEGEDGAPASEADQTPPERDEG